MLLRDQEPHREQTKEQALYILHLREQRAAYALEVNTLPIEQLYPIEMRLFGQPCSPRLRDHLGLDTEEEAAE